MFKVIIFCALLAVCLSDVLIYLYILKTRRLQKLRIMFISISPSMRILWVESFSDCKSLICSIYRLLVDMEKLLLEQCRTLLVCLQVNLELERRENHCITNTPLSTVSFPSLWFKEYDKNNHSICFYN